MALLSVAAVNVAPVFAQDSEAALEEVIVTAQRREQNLQEVPISVTAFSGATIERQNVKSAIDFLALTPNVSFTEDGQSGSRGLGIAIRGINNLVSGENAFVNSVGIYIDEFSVASVPNQVANPNLADMERVEVLRGPQGTFFGRNALGGALSGVVERIIESSEKTFREISIVALGFTLGVHGNQHAVEIGRAIRWLALDVVMLLG